MKKNTTLQDYLKRCMYYKYTKKIALQRRSGYIFIFNVSACYP